LVLAVSNTNRYHQPKLIFDLISDVSNISTKTSKRHPVSEYSWIGYQCTLQRHIIQTLHSDQPHPEL